jgi:hypothetical protein
MPEFRTYVDIEPDEFLSNCSDSEINEIVNYLLEEGHLDGEPITSKEHHNLLDEEWATTIGKLNRSRLLLSNEDEETIRRIVNKF